MLVSLNASILCLVIALAGALGGLGFAAAGATSLGYLAAVLALLALALSEFGHRLSVRLSPRVAEAAGADAPAR
ncbi:hypothetical protein GCM10009801_26140 [Streptomyces albiaxialis]|uniref:Uncharacterized protein n=1 Tax=Streptomyces albiaxialis TaxID=329523 RepID=A0ABN2VVA8_9ACTN